MASPKHLLVVDDDPTITRLIQFNLEREGYAVDVASNGAEALDRLRQKSYALVISDVTMPELDGFQLVQQIRKNPRTVNLPVLLLTAKTEIEDVTRGYETGTDLYLTKPCKPEQLLAHVRRALGESGGTG
jgi:DNA-binding response OmpR family regulator